MVSTFGLIGAKSLNSSSEPALDKRGYPARRRRVSLCAAFFAWEMSSCTECRMEASTLHEIS